jgi:tryptophan 2,3-dioxygenase
MVTAKEPGEPLTYGVYLRVPELLDLQSPLSKPEVHDEMLFILGQQAQELWFKQILHELRVILEALDHSEILRAVRLLDRVNRILRILSQETDVLATLEPRDFNRFRGHLQRASGFESRQFRELEIASGLRDEAYLKMISRIVDTDAIVRRWPVSLADAFRSVLTELAPDAVQAIVRVYDDPDDDPGVHLLADALSEYDQRFQEWRFHHLQVVERVIGDRSPGTGGSAGSGYLMRTLTFRFFPELWEARNRLTAASREL